MKTRQGFVSNSSSSSFIIKKEGLSDLQKFAIENHMELATWLKSKLNPEQYSMYEWLEEWDVTDDGDSYWCCTDMDNFPLKSFLRQFGIEMERERY